VALLVLRSVGVCVGQNQMCHLCGGRKTKNERWAKIKSLLFVCLYVPLSVTIAYNVLAA